MAKYLWAIECPVCGAAALKDCDPKNRGGELSSADTVHRARLAALESPEGAARAAVIRKLAAAPGEWV